MKKLKAFFLGMVEFRSTFTMYYTSRDLKQAYDKGREFMHQATFRRYE